jgi:hypothetical protein
LAASVVLSRYANMGSMLQVTSFLPGFLQSGASSLWQATPSPARMRSGAADMMSVSDDDIDGILSDLQAAKDELT